MKKRQIKYGKILVLAAAVLMLTLAVFVGNATEASAAENSELTYEIINDEVTITDCAETATGVIEIPATIDGLPVTFIAKEAFYNCKNVTEVIIPKGVTGIGAYAFYKCTSLTNVTLPEGIITIGNNAFEGCTAMTGINIPATVEFVDEYAFTGCSALKSVYIADLTAWCKIEFVTASSNPLYYKGNIYIDDTKVTELVIPSDVTTIGKYSFYNAAGLTSVTISKELSEIGNEAFYGCSGLSGVYIADLAAWCEVSFENVTANPLYYAKKLYLNGTLLTELIIPDSVKEISQYAFCYATSITSITVPNTVTVIGDSAFRGCSNLESITIPFIGKQRTQATDTYQYPFGIIFGSSSYTGGTSTEQRYYGASATSTSSSTFYIPTKLKKVTFTGDRLPYGAFYNCKKLTTVVLEKSVTDIGAYAFYSCTGLASITIPNSVTNIGAYAFYSCTGLASITIPNSVTTIGDTAFAACSGARSVTFGTGLLSVGTGAFSSCSALTGVYISDLSAWCKIDFASSSANPLTIAKKLYLNNRIIEALVIPEGVEAIGPFAFYGANITSVSFPNTLKSIGKYCFAGCTGLTDISIPNSATSIGSYAFYNCTGLTSVTLAEGLTEIGSNAFEKCTGLTSMTIPDSVTTIGGSAFNGCSNLESLTIPFIGKQRTQATDTYQYPFGYIFGSSSYTGGTATTQTYYGSSASSTSSSVFYIPTKLKTVTVTGDRLPYGAFYNCENLTTVVLEKSVTQIGYNAFYNCSDLTSVTMEEGVTKIGAWAFSACSKLTSISIPSSVTSIDAYAFSSELTDVYITDLAAWCNIQFSSETANPLYRAENFYVNNQRVDALVIPEGVETISNYAFYKADFTSVSLPNTVKSIGKHAFGNCSALTGISIPYSVTSINSYAFYNCTGLTSVTLAEGLTEISSNAFQNCTGLTSISIPNSVATIGTGAFSGCSNLESITIPFIGKQRTQATDTYQYPFGYIFGTSSYTGGTATKQYYCYTGSSTTSGTYYIPAKLRTVTVTGGYVPYGAFYNCSGLTSVTLEEGVTEIGESVFAGCSNLESITIPFVGNKPTQSGSTYQYPFGYIFGTSSYTGGTATKQYYYGSSTSSTTSATYYIPSKLKTVTVTGGRLPYGAFYNCSGLISVTLEEGVTGIGSEAFYYCTGLTSISIPGSVRSIGSEAFYYCTGLTSITLAEGLTQIGYNAFYKCSALTSVTIPDSVTTIERAAFEACSNLESITIPFVGNNRTLANSTYQYPFGYIFGTYSYTGGTSTKQYYYGSSASSTATATYYIPAKLKTVIFTGSRLPYGAFYNCSGLTSVILSEKLTEIGSNAFYCCNGLNSISIPSGVKSIGSHAFYNCSGLTNVMIPDGMTSILDHAFLGCSNLTVVTMPDSVTFVGENAFPAVKKLVIATGSQKITKVMVVNAGSLTEIVIPNTVTYVQKGALDGCIAVQGTTHNDIVYLGNAENPYLLLYKAPTTITEATIHQDVKLIYAGAFAGCSSLVGTQADGVVYLGNPENPYMVIYDVPKDIKDLTLRAETKFIYDGAFNNCTSLRRLTITDKLYPNDYTQFAGCGITELMFADGTVRIDSRMVVCKGTVQQILIPESVTTIGANAFYNCTALKHVLFVGDTPQIAADSFTNVSATGHLAKPWDDEHKQNYGGTMTWVETTLAAGGKVPEDSKTRYNLNEEIVIPYVLKTYTTEDGIVFHQRLNEAVVLGSYDNSTIGQKTVSVQSGETSLNFQYVVKAVVTPVKAEVEKVTNNTITLVAVDGYEYSLDGEIWQASPAFTGLNPNQSYSFYQRLVETDSVYLSQPSEAITVTTLKNTAVKLDAPIVSATTGISVALEVVAGAEYSMDGVTWQSSNVFTGLTAVTDYTFYQRMAETDTTYAGETSEGKTVRTPKYTVSPPDVPEVSSKTVSSITLVAVSGCEYSINGTTWQDSPVFSGLKVYTTYTVYQRYKETDDSFASMAKSLTVTTHKNTVAAPRAPGILERKQTSITLVYKAGYEYSMNGTTWQSSATFTGLSMDTTYRFYQRLAETPTSYASAASLMTTVRTLGKLSNTITPEKPILVHVSNNSISLLAIDGYEYKIGNGEWQTSPVFDYLDWGGSYTLYQRIQETATHKASATSQGITVNLDMKPSVAFGQKMLSDYIEIYGTTLSNGNKRVTKLVSNTYVYLEKTPNGIYCSTSDGSTYGTSVKYYFGFWITMNRYINPTLTIEGYYNSKLVSTSTVDALVDRTTYTINTNIHLDGYQDGSNAHELYNAYLSLLCTALHRVLLEDMVGIGSIGFLAFTEEGDEAFYCDAALNHQLGNRVLKYAYPATCERQGYTGDYCCSYCGETIEKGTSIPKLSGHTYSNSCDSTCNRCSQSRYVPHSYSGDCDTTCNNCSAQRASTGIAHYYDLPTDVNCYVCGHQKLVAGISIATQPSKKVYAEGENLDLTGLVVNAKFDDGSSHAITGYTVSGFTSSAGTKTIRISYGAYTATFQVTVNHVYSSNCDKVCDKCGSTRTTSTPHTYDDVKDMVCNLCQETRTVSSIAVEKAPTKLVYAEGEALDMTGLVVKAQFSDGSTALITDYTVSGDTNVAGQITITVSYEQKTATFKITVNHVYPHACATICSKCGEVAARDTKHTFDDVKDMICNICGEDKKIVRIAVEKMPDKVLYLEDEVFESAGLVVKVYYCDDSSEEITTYTLTGYTTTPGIKTVVVTYEGHTTTFEVTVKSRIPSTITSTEYAVNDGVISAIGAGTTLEQLLAGIEEGEFCTVYADGEPLAMDKLVGTGMIIKIMDGEETKIELVIVVAGDVNGDGKISVTDMLAVKAHLLDKEKLDGAHAQAADVTDDNKLSITDFIQVKAHLLGKEQISVAKAAPVMAQAIQEPAQSAEYVIVSVPVVEITTKEIAAPVSKEEIL